MSWLTGEVLTKLQGSRTIKVLGCRPEFSNINMAVSPLGYLGSVHVLGERSSAHAWMREFHTYHNATVRWRDMTVAVARVFWA